MFSCTEHGASVAWHAYGCLSGPTPGGIGQKPCSDLFLPEPPFAARSLEVLLSNASLEEVMLCWAVRSLWLESVTVESWGHSTAGVVSAGAARGAGTEVQA